jgi:hypothetical protein
VLDLLRPDDRVALVGFADAVQLAAGLTEVAGIARRTGVVVYSVSAGAPGKASYLSQLSDATGGRLIEVETTRDLNAVFVQVLSEFRHRYVLAFSPRGVPPSGWHTLDVRLKSRRATVKARPGYFVER